LSSTVDSDTRKFFNDTLASNQEALITILNTYSNDMRSSSSDPLTTFVNAYINYARQTSTVWFVASWQMSTATLTAPNVINVMMRQCPRLFAYLKGWQMGDFSESVLGLSNGGGPAPYLSQ